jgi:hypothetical protein
MGEEARQRSREHAGGELTISYSRTPLRMESPDGAYIDGNSSAFFIALGEVGMCVVVDSIARHDSPIEGTYSAVEFAVSAWPRAVIRSSSPSR